MALFEELASGEPFRERMGPTNARIVRGVGGVRKDLSPGVGLGIVDGLTSRFSGLEPLIAASTYVQG